jgi:23S rRNA pseudouridine2604 synthase
VDSAFINNMRNGVMILGTVTMPCFVKPEGDSRFRIILKQGLNRQIRRMCETLGYKVTSLKRIRIMLFNLHSLPVGKWRYFTTDEINLLNSLVATSSKTADPDNIGE